MIEPQAFDVFGIFVFLVLFAVGISLFRKYGKDKKETWIILLVSVLGLIVDGYNVFVNIILK